MPGPSTTGIPASYLPAYKAGLTLHVVAAVTGAAARLGALVTIPIFPDERYTFSSGPTLLRCPYHIIFQVPAAAANPVYLTWDNNTAPVVGGPGLELEQGQVYKFENAGVNLVFCPGSASKGFYPFNANSAFQVIATAATNLLVNFTD
jgi:hypothetical protein